jgi:tetratricopeptide (TPR) repeat protein
MTYAELKTKYTQVFDFINRSRIREAMDTLRDLCNHGRNLDLRMQLDGHNETYFNLLKYSFELSDDPQKELVYNRLIKAIISLADDVKEDIVRSHNLLKYYRLRMIPESVSDHTIQEVARLTDQLALIRESGSAEPVGKGLAEFMALPVYKEKMRDLFYIIWQSDKLKDTEIELLSKLSKPDTIAWYDKCVLVSALTLSLIRHFDSNKIDQLFNFYEAGEMQVWQRALVGLVLGLTYFDKRIKYYPEIMMRLRAIQGLKPEDKSMEIVIIQFIKARETEKITRKIQQDILPEMIKMKSKLEEKLDLENLLSSNKPEDKNPEWETFFKDSPDIYNKLEEFTNLQLEGADVFLGAFAMLKQFDFFNEIHNWFLPFHKDNEYVSAIFSDVSEGFDVGQFAEGIERSNFLCNSDKYSFCLNVRHMPAFQKSTVMELFNMELKAMNEMARDDELINSNARTGVIITQYFHDLYRFYKLHPLKQEFDDVFNLPVNIHEAAFFKLWIDDLNMLRNIGEFFFGKNYYSDACLIFTQIIEKNQNYELFEKIGFCWQKTGNFTEALANYHKAELLDRNRLWLLTRIAWCYRKTGDYDKAVMYYHEAEKLEPENLEVQAWLGQTLLEMEDYEEALKYYFKVEYLQPGNHKVKRPISWCSFMLGKLDRARKYLEKSLEQETSKNDFLNMGHIYWCMHNKPKAIENYKKSLQAASMDFTWFARAMADDSKHLTLHGIQAFDIPLMIDYIMMSP